MTKTAAKDVAVIASAIAIPFVDGEPAKRFRLVPFGTFRGRDGRGPWHLNGREHAERVVAATKGYLAGVDFLVNYDHQTEFAAVQGVGGQAKAAGWVKPDDLQVGDDGIYVEADWTGPAYGALQAREYRYYSPHFRADKATGELTRLVNVGLTNSPNIEVSALASQDAGASPAEGSSMSIAKLLSATALTALGLTADSDDEAAINSIDELVEANSATVAILASVRTRFELANDADEETVLAAIDSAAKAGEPDPSKFVPIGALKEVKDQLATINEERVINAVDAAIEAGKITPGQKDWAIKLGNQDMGELNAFLDTAPVFKGGKQIEGKPDARKGQLDEDEAAICAQLGLSPEDYLKTRNSEQENA
jgi:phage I-like protein